MKLSPRNERLRPIWESAQRIAGGDSAKAGAGIAVTAALSLSILWGVPSLSAQSPEAIPVPEPRSHQLALPRRVPHGEGPVNPALPGTSAIRFENSIQASKIKFNLRNSVSPQRYTFETMVGGVAIFDYNNDDRLDVLFTNGAAIPSLEKGDPS